MDLWSHEMSSRMNLNIFGTLKYVSSLHNEQTVSFTERGKSL